MALKRLFFLYPDCAYLNLTFSLESSSQKRDVTREFSLDYLTPLKVERDLNCRSSANESLGRMYLFNLI